MILAKTLLELEVFMGFFTKFDISQSHKYLNHQNIFEIAK